MDTHFYILIHITNIFLPIRLAFMGTRQVQNHRATHLDQACPWFKHSAVSIIKSSIIFQKGFLHFYILLGPWNYKAGPAMIRNCRKLMWHEQASIHSPDGAMDQHRCYFDKQQEWTDFMSKWNKKKKRFNLNIMQL